MSKRISKYTMPWDVLDQINNKNNNDKTLI